MYLTVCFRPSVCRLFYIFCLGGVGGSFTTDLSEAAILQTHECKSRKGWGVRIIRDL